MLTVVHQTRKQKVKMYMRLKKKKLAKMLAERSMLEQGPQVAVPYTLTRGTYCGSPQESPAMAGGQSCQ